MQIQDISIVLAGIDGYDWTLTTSLHLYDNQLSNIEAGAFTGLGNLTYLSLYNNQIHEHQRGGLLGVKQSDSHFIAQQSPHKYRREHL